jgi:hypothetical protein
LYCKARNISDKGTWRRVVVLAWEELIREIILLNNYLLTKYEAKTNLVA